MSQESWASLSPRQQRVIVVAGAVEGALKVAALVDLARRPATEVRGSKLGWAVAITVVNAGGAVPLAYFTRGRR